MSVPNPKLATGEVAALTLGLFLVAIGIVNNIPALPGLDNWARSVADDPTLAVRKFSYEYLHPAAFVIMMTVVALKHSFFRSFRSRSAAAQAASLAMDVALVAMALAIGVTYLVEIEAVCLVDQLTGERAELIARSLKEEQEFARSFGLPVPNSVEDPQCVNTLGVWLFAVVGGAVTVFLAYNVKVWGLPLVAVAIAIAAYTMLTVLVWYVHGAEDINKYLMTKLGGEPRQLIDGRPKVHDILVSNGQGLLGRFMDILMNTVFPYIVLGSLFGISAGGQALIKVAFLWTRRMRGGPAHAAIVSSAMFGTISGGPIVNVMSTGVLTIPMMIRRGFNRTFAGGVEAAASSGGQVMPPVMGVAAFVLSALTLVPYREVIIAASVPAIAYFGCLFLTAAFQARSQGIEAVGKATDDMRLTRDDRLHLLMIFGPILLILLLLLTPKEAIGCGALGWLFGLDGVRVDGVCRVQDMPWAFQLLQNSAGDAGSAGWWAMFFLMGLLFLDREVRAAPMKLARALGDAGILVSTLYLMFLAVSVIDFCLNFTGLSDFIARDLLIWLRGFQLEAGSTSVFLFSALLVTMAMAVLLGMGMPTVPAYINVALLMGPMLVGLGIASFTAHMFIFYFAVASAITPPVAIAAFAAASITKADPMATGFSAVRSGIVMFVIPFVFAFYPELLLIDAAVLDPADGAGGYLEGYTGKIDFGGLGVLCARLLLALYLMASALARFDRHRLAAWECAVRLILAALVIAGDSVAHVPAIIAAAAFLAWHWARKGRA